MDDIRVCKIFELIQYAIVFYILVLIATGVLNKYYYTDEEISHSNVELMFSILLDLVVIILAFFYIRKIALLVPSIPNLLYPKFKDHTTLDYSVDIALVVLLIELLPKFKSKVENLVELIQN
tara:strand:+ start:173 stop:538 length:366 start_codon:yes stop_codon:yes gene_type:complete